MSPHVEAISERLQRTWVQWWLFSLLANGVLAVSLALGMLLIFAGIDAVLPLPQGALWALFLVWVLMVLALFGGLYLRHRQGRRSLEATARRVEMECPELGSHLINLVQLASEEEEGKSPAFTEAAVAQAAEAVRDYPFERSALQRRAGGVFCCACKPPRRGRSRGRTPWAGRHCPVAGNVRAALGVREQSALPSLGLRAVGRLGQDRRGDTPGYGSAGGRRSGDRCPHRKPQRAGLQRHPLCPA